MLGYAACMALAWTALSNGRDSMLDYIVLSVERVLP